MSNKTILPKPTEIHPGIHTIPDLPTTVKICIGQIHKMADGVRKADFGTPYDCSKLPTARGRTTFGMKLTTSGPPCDEEPVLVPDGSVLDASGDTTLRKDGLAHFVGTFTITRPDHKVLFQGTMEILDRIGPFGASCRLENHVEGWLVGQQGPEEVLPGVTLHAMIAGQSTLQLPQKEGSVASSVHAALNGILIKGPRKA